MVELFKVVWTPFSASEPLLQSRGRCYDGVAAGVDVHLRQKSSEVIAQIGSVSVASGLRGPDNFRKLKLKLAN